MHIAVHPTVSTISGCKKMGAPENANLKGRKHFCVLVTVYHRLPSFSIMVYDYSRLAGQGLAGTGWPWMTDTFSNVLINERVECCMIGCAVLQ